MALAMYTVGVSVEDSVRPRPYVHSYSVRLFVRLIFQSCHDLILLGID